MNTPEEKQDMVRMNLLLEQEHHDKLVTTKKITRISKSDLIRIALDQLWAELGDVSNPNPEALARLLKLNQHQSVRS
jgi:hypothetical protein